MAKKHSVLYTWGISYLFILILMIILSFFMNHVASRQLVKEYKDITTSLQRQAKESLYSYIQDMQNQANRFCSDTSITNYVSSIAPGPDYYNLLLIQDRLDNAVLSTQYPSTVYLYMNNVNKVLTPSTVYDSDLIYQQLSSSLTVSEDFFQELLHSRFYNKILTFSSDDNTRKVIAMFTSLPLASPSPKGLLIQVMDQELLQNIIESRNILPDSSTVLMDDTGEVLCSSGASDIVQSIPSLPSVHDSEIKIGEASYWVAQETLAFENWNLITLHPMSSIFQKTKWVTDLTLPALIIMLIIGVIASLIFIYLNYRPLLHLKNIYFRTPADTKNEFERIGSAFETMHNQLQSLHHLQQQQAEQLKLEFLKSCLEKELDLDETGMLIILENLGIKLDNDYFLIFLFDVAQEELTDTYTGTSILTSLAPSCFPLKEFGTVSLFIKEESPVLFVHFSDISLENSIRNIVKNSFIEDKQRVPFKLTLASSAVHKGFSEIHLAYLEACELMDYKKHLHPDISDNNSKILSLPSGNKLYFPSVQEELLIRYITAGNSVSALDVLQLIYQHNFDEQNLSLILSRCLMEDISLEILKALSASHSLTAELQDEFIHTLDIIRRTTSRTQMKELVNHLVNVAALHSQEAKKLKKTSKMIPLEKITDCVNQHFSECDFNVSKTAEYLGCNVPYLSKYFKEKTGIGLLNYINGVRINYAKQLMTTEKITVTSAAKRAGFENPNTFIRLFKKFEGQTPGVFLEKDE